VRNSGPRESSDSEWLKGKRKPMGIKGRMLRGKWPFRMGIREERLVEVGASGNEDKGRRVRGSGY
jgi:hypothetical protein